MATATNSSSFVDISIGQSGAGLRFAVEVNRLFTDKVKPGDSRFWRLNMTFRREQMTAAELREAIHQGYTWTAPHRKERHRRPDGKRTTFRVKRNVIGVQAVGLDSDTGDERSALAWWTADPFFAAFGAFAHTTASHTDERPRCRVVFVLPELLTVEDAERLLRALHDHYPHVDHSAKDACRLFYGAAGCQFVAPDNVMPLEVAQAFIQEVQQHEDELRLAAEARRAAFASSHQDRKANAGAVAAYVASAKDRRLAYVAAAVEGTGERHERLIEAAFRLGSLRGASWLTEPARRVLLGVEDELLDAARANGYAAKYGEEATRREVLNSVALGERSPATEPNWRDFADFFAVGDPVAVVHQGEVLARGRVAELRKSSDEADYSFRLAGGSVWYPRAWLRHDDGRGDGFLDPPDDEPDEGPDFDGPDDWPEPDFDGPDMAQDFFAPAGATERAAASWWTEEQERRRKEIERANEYQERRESIQRARDFFRETYPGGDPALGYEDERIKKLGNPIQFMTTLKTHIETGEWVFIHTRALARRDSLSQLKKDAWRLAKQIEEEQNAGRVFYLSTLPSEADWRRARDAWQKRRTRSAGAVGWQVYRQEDKTVIVLHDDAQRGGELIPTELDKLIDLTRHLLLAMPEEEVKRVRSSPAFGGNYQGSRGDGRTKREGRDDWQVITQLKTEGAPGINGAAAALGIELSPTRRGKRQINHEEAILALGEAGFVMTPKGKGASVEAILAGQAGQMSDIASITTNELLDTKSDIPAPPKEDDGAAGPAFAFSHSDGRPTPPAQDAPGAQIGRADDILDWFLETEGQASGGVWRSAPAW